MHVLGFARMEREREVSSVKLNAILFRSLYTFAIHSSSYISSFIKFVSSTFICDCIINVQLMALVREPPNARGSGIGARFGRKKIFERA